MGAGPDAVIHEMTALRSIAGLRRFDADLGETLRLTPDGSVSRPRPAAGVARARPAAR
jgi:hypothetical protein